MPETSTDPAEAAANSRAARSTGLPQVKHLAGSIFDFSRLQSPLRSSLVKSKMAVVWERESSCCSEPPSEGIFVEVSTVKEAAKWSMFFMEQLLPYQVRPAAIFDIDGTLLINPVDEDASDEEDRKTRKVKPWESAIGRCAELGVAVFVITARPRSSSQEKWTLGQLKLCGLEPPLLRGLYMMPEKGCCGDGSVRAYKESARQDVRRRGYSAVLCVGDQYWDISAKDPPEFLKNDAFYVAWLSDDGRISVKLPSEMR